MQVQKEARVTVRILGDAETYRRELWATRTSRLGNIHDDDDDDRSLAPQPIKRGFIRPAASCERAKHKAGLTVDPSEWERETCGTNKHASIIHMLGSKKNTQGFCSCACVCVWGGGLIR